jgi:tetratricopeptide (TPR) repeat protein
MLTLSDLRSAWADESAPQPTTLFPQQNSGGAAALPLPSPAVAAVATFKRRRFFRIFVSSTFMDMEMDRAYFNNEIFPALERRCRARNIGLSAVDLQWGVPGGTPNAEVLHTCFRELAQCATSPRGEPIFLYLGGARYGWAPPLDAVPPDLLKRERWLPGASVTTMEVLVGGLRGPNPNALFALRADAYIESLPAPLRYGAKGEDKFRTPEVASCQLALRAAIEERIPAHQVLHYNPAAEVTGACSSGGSAEAPLPGWPAFCTAVEERLWALMEALSPDAAACGGGVAAEDLVSWREAEAVVHENHVQTLLSFATPREALLDAVVEAVERGGGRPVVLAAPSGNGKSSIAAAAARALAQRGLSVASHFVGGGARSEVLVTLGRRIVAEAMRRDGGGELSFSDLPGDDAAACARARVALSKLPSLSNDGRSSSSGNDGGDGGMLPPPPFLFLIDAVNQLQGRDAAHRLAWLPLRGALCPRARLLLTVAVDEANDGGADLTELLLRLPNAILLRVGPLAHSERVAVCNGLLASYHKRLSPEHTEALCANVGAASPAWLRLALRSLRLHATFDTLSASIADLAPTVGGLVDAELGAVEARLGRAPTMALATLLAVARGDLSEREAAFLVPLLVQVLESSGGEGDGGGGGSPRTGATTEPPASPRSPLPRPVCGEPLPPLHLLRLTGSLLFLLRDENSDALALAHGLLTAAVARRYGKAACNAARAVIVKFFSSDAFAAAVLPLRRVLELPFQLAALSQWQQLADVLAAPWALTDMWAGEGQWEWLEYARACGEGAPQRYTRARAALVAGWGARGTALSPSPHLYIELLVHACHALVEMAGYDEASSLLRLGLEGEGVMLDGEASPPRPAGASCAGALALLARAEMLTGNYARAKSVLKVAIPAAEEAAAAGAPEPLGLSLRVLGNTHEKLAEYEPAHAAYMRALQVRRSLLGEAHPDVVAVHANIGYVLGSQDKLSEARAEYELALALALRGGDPHAACVGVARNGLAFIQWRQGDCASALPNFEAALLIRQRAYGCDHPLCAATTNNIALVFCALGRYEESAHAARCAIALRVAALGSAHLDVARSQQNLGATLEEWGGRSEGEARVARLREAAASYATAAATRRAALRGTDHAFVVASLVSVARVQLRLGEPEAAGVKAGEAYAMQLRLQGAGGRPDGDTLLAASFLGDARDFEASGKLREAAEYAGLTAQLLQLACGEAGGAYLRVCAVAEELLSRVKK